MGEQFLPITAPKGRGAAGVTVDDEGVSVEHRLLKDGLRIPIGQIVGAVRVSTRERDRRILHRQPRLVRLPMGSIDSNVAILFDPPFRATGFTMGSEKALTITKRERKGGAELDGLTFGVTDPDGMVAALERRGVHRFATVGDASVALVGEATGEEAAKIRARRNRSLDLFAVGACAVGIVFVVLAAARAAAIGVAGHEPFPFDRWGRFSAWGLGWGVVLALVFAFGASSTSSAAGPPEAIDDRPARGDRRALLAMLAVFGVIVATAAVAKATDVADEVVWGPLLGAAGAVPAGFGFRLVRRLKT